MVAAAIASRSGSGAAVVSAPSFHHPVDALLVLDPVPREADVDEGPGGHAVVYRSGGASRGGPTRGALSSTGVPAWEPTLGVTEAGWIFYQAFGPDTGGPPDVVRSKDGGETWEVVTPEIAARRRHVASFDPYLYVDPRTSRVFTADLSAGPNCSQLSFSDDGGERGRARSPGAKRPTMRRCSRDRRR